ncbi:MAG: DUF5320 domain-containing protein, partial [Anaerolineae bacterium]|nr:DUF5320 domain-containing protein [Anaerolineae bacterium]
PQVVLTRLIQSGGDTLESLRTRVLAAFDPQSQFDEELHRRLDVLVARGELAVEEAAAWLKKLTSQHEPPPPAQPEVSETSDIDALLRQVQALEAELEALKK